MVYKFSKTFFAFICILWSASTAFAQNPKKIEDVVIKTNIVCSHCKKCETCGQLFKSGLTNLKGVKNYQLDEKAMTIKVTYQPKKTTVEKIRMAISKLGYDADDVKADPAGYAKLDSCCKK